MAQARVLIVEDEPTQSILLEGILKKAGHIPEAVATGNAAISRLADSKSPSIDVVLLDLVMPGMNGIEVLQHIRPSLPALPVIMLTAHSSVRTVVDAMQAGANDFIVKPASAERIRTAVEAAMDTTSFVGEIAPVSDSIKGGGFDSLVGTSSGMRRAVGLAEKAASTSIPVMIEGESGVGKEVFARAIHAASDRATQPFVAVNCGAIPENLVESILFGHEKGAFTGATEKRPGKFQEADGGTLFLDEVGELPADVQVKLLRAIQEKEVDPVGARDSVRVDIRVVSATNRNMAERVAEGAFREDLFYRLNVYPVLLPPLRERMEDVPALVEHFLDHIAAMEDLPRCTIGSAAMDRLMAYHWPGNIRQLQNALFRAVILSDHQKLLPDDFPHLMGEPKTAAISPPLNAPITAPQESHTNGALSIADAHGHIRLLASIEADIIKAALDRYDGKMTEVAKRLGIGRSTLYRKVEEYGLGEK